MTGRPAHRARLAAGLFLVAFAAAACGATTPTAPAATLAPIATPAPMPAPTPEPTPSPTPTATPTEAPSPTASATPVPSGATGGDPAAGLKIVSPYKLGRVTTASANTMKAILQGSVDAATYAKVRVGLKLVYKGKTATAVVMVIRFPAGTLTDAAYQALRAQISRNSTVKVTTTMVAGYELTMGKTSVLYLGGYHHGDDAILVIAAHARDVVPVAAAVIAANP